MIVTLRGSFSNALSTKSNLFWKLSDRLPALPMSWATWGSTKPLTKALQSGSSTPRISGTQISWIPCLWWVKKILYLNWKSPIIHIGPQKILSIVEIINPIPSNMDAILTQLLKCWIRLTQYQLILIQLKYNWSNYGKDWPNTRIRYAYFTPLMIQQTCFVVSVHSFFQELLGVTHFCGTNDNATLAELATYRHYIAGQLASFIKGKNGFNR